MLRKQREARKLRMIYGIRANIECGPEFGDVAFTLLDN